MLAYIYVPVLQRELNLFSESIWNSHRGRKQKNKELPVGIPDHIYSFPALYGGSHCGFQLSDEDLQEVADLSGVLQSNTDYLEPSFRQECERHIQDAGAICSSKAADAYLLLKANFERNNLID